MTGPQGFLDNLENLRLTTAVALEHVQEHVHEFAKSASPQEMRRAERLISKVRMLSDELEREFATLEKLLGRARAN
jgi:hypothetical protein